MTIPTPPLLGAGGRFPILPGAALGVLGSGQLGRMFALAARRMGYRVHTFSPDTDTPTGQVADVEIVADYHDLEAVRDFARHVRAVTFEFENVPAATAEAVAALVPVRPNGSVLHVTQSRLREKTWLAGAGLPHTPFRAVASRAELDDALRALGCPAILKTAGFGYDGKGQVRLGELADADAAWDELGGQECVLEAFVPFARELSVVAARGADGAFVHYGVLQNAHVHGILDVSVTLTPPELGAGGGFPDGVPAPPELGFYWGGAGGRSLELTAVEVARTVLDGLGVVGVLCVEFFQTAEGALLINELAPRPHNSGHLTIDACAASQFEQQLRAVCGLPLASTAPLRPAAMANLLGDLWQEGEPDWAAALALPGVKLHLYGKEDARPGRKMGHLTALADTPAAAERLVRRARAALTPH